jgi:hypothetical protein
MRELLLTSLGGRQYGIWKDAILSVRDLHALHRIPLSPARIAGIMIDDGQTVTLADLSVCIGYGSSPATGPGCILLLAEGEKVTGFVASGELRTQPIAPRMLFPLPDYLKTPVFDTCAVHDGISIPIINIAELYSRALQSGKESSVGALRVPAAQPQDISGAERIRFFTIAGERQGGQAGIGHAAAKFASLCEGRDFSRRAPDDSHRFDAAHQTTERSAGIPDADSEDSKRCVRFSDR